MINLPQINYYLNLDGRKVMNDRIIDIFFFANCKKYLFIISYEIAWFVGQRTEKK